MVLTDAPPERAVRADAPSPSRVVSRPRHQWATYVAELWDAGTGRGGHQRRVLAHLRVQAGLPPAVIAETGRHAAWVSVLAPTGASFTGPPVVASFLTAVPMPSPATGTGRFVAVLALLENRDLDQLRDGRHDLRRPPLAPMIPADLEVATPMLTVLAGRPGTGKSR